MYFVIKNIEKILSNKKAYLASILRLIISPAIIVTIFKIFGVDGTSLLLMLFAFAAPHGLNTVIYPASSGNDTAPGASMSVISHTFSVITMPIMYVLFTMFIG